MFTHFDDNFGVNLGSALRVDIVVGAPQETETVRCQSSSTMIKLNRTKGQNAQTTSMSAASTTCSSMDAT